MYNDRDRYGGRGGYQFTSGGGRRREAREPLEISEILGTIWRSKGFIALVGYIAAIVILYHALGGGEQLQAVLISYSLKMMFLIWLAFLGGASWFADSWIAVRLNFLAPRWNTLGIQVFAVGMMFYYTLFLVIGLYDPAVMNMMD